MKGQLVSWIGSNDIISMFEGTITTYRGILIPEQGNLLICFTVQGKLTANRMGPEMLKRIARKGPEVDVGDALVKAALTYRAAQEDLELFREEALQLWPKQKQAATQPA
jgi:hypothetical protein